MAFEFSVGLICLTTGFIFLWLWRKTSEKEHLTTKTKDYLYVSLICFGAAIYAGASTPLYGNISPSNIYLCLQIAVFGVLLMIAFFIHFLSSYNQKPYVAPAVDLFCIMLFTMCVLDFRFYRGIDSLVTYKFTIASQSVTLHRPDIGYKMLSTAALLIVVYSTYIFGVAYFTGKHKHVGYLLAGSFLLAILGLHDVLWALQIVKKPLYHLFEFGMLAFIAGMAMKLLLDFFDTFSTQESQIGRLRIEGANFWTISKGTLKVDEADEAFILKLSGILKEKIGDPELTVAGLANTMHMTTATLRRHLNRLTGQPTQDFIRNQRVELGGYLLKNTTASISQIAYEVGFSSPGYFSQCFKEYYGMSPSKYREEALTH